MLAQLVNFAIVAGVLWYFALKPIMAAMARRTKIIEQGIRDAQASETMAAQAKADYEDLIRDARREATEIVARAQEQAEQKAAATLEATRADVRTIVQEGKVQLARDREQLMRDARTELADLVTRAVKAVVPDLVDRKTDRKLIEQAIKHIES